MESTKEPSSTHVDGKPSVNDPEKTKLPHVPINVHPLSSTEKQSKSQLQSQSQSQSQLQSQSQSQQPPTTNPTKRQQSKLQVSFFKSIPRTIRWRIQLGLLTLPSSVSTAVDAANLTLKNSTRNQNQDLEKPKLFNKEEQQASHNTVAAAVETVLESETISKSTTNSSSTSPSPSPSPSPSSYTIKDVFEFNQAIIQKQHERFDQLSKKHLWENSPLALIEKEEKEAYEKSKVSASDSNNDTDKKVEMNEKIRKVPCTNGSDPLSAMMMEDKQTNQKDADLHNQPNDSNTEESKNEEKVKKETSSSWSEFYSSRETLSLIEKDLNRLAPSHHIVTPVSTLYSSPANTKNNTPDLEDIHQNKENDKSTSDKLNAEYKKEQRSQLLAQILFIYARQNPSLGYRQGMHEILSFILIAFEVDFHNAHNRNNKKQQMQTQTQTQTQTNQIGDTDDEDDKGYHLSFFQKEKLSHDLFLIFETIMYHLSPGYDFESCTITPPPHLSKNADDPNEKKENHNNQSMISSMDHIAETILRHVRLNSSEQLYHHLTNELNIPAQLYCARWVRLMFIREIPSIEKSLFLWDKIFHNMHRKHLYLISILEFICAAMILRIQEKFYLRDDNVDHYNSSYDDDDFDPNESINLLMNYPPIDDVKGFWKIVADLIEGRHRKPSTMKKQNIMTKTATNAINTVQNLALPLVMGAGRAITSSSPQQIYRRHNSHEQQQHQHQHQHQQHFNGVFNRMTNMYHEKRVSNEARDNSNSNQIIHTKNPLHPLQFPRNKNKYGHEHMMKTKDNQGIYNEQNHQNQKDAMHHTFSRMTNTFSKAIDSIGGSIENLVVNATSQGNANNRNIAFDNSQRMDHQLSQSVQTISKYLQESGMNVPNDVWEALATVDSIGNQIAASESNRN